MKAALTLAAIFALLCTGVGVAILTIDAHHCALEAQRALKDIDDEVRVQGENLANDEQRLNLVLGHVDATVGQLNLAAAEQRAYWQKTSADSDKTVKALRLAVDRTSLFLDHADKELNGVLLPNFDRNFALTSMEAQKSLSAITGAANELTIDLRDLGPTFANVGEGSARLANAAGHADKILADGEKTADYYEKKLTTPASFAHRVAMGALDVGSKLGNIMAGFVK